ncbi:hypothetical protein F444_03008 [Phytophthora nicotianae P1976]|uniref:C-terminal of Roc (COR) domain-containing protein n=1 Tax=Phytophthora nicotianae P1976 TaxID=1317066 RepID=A0A081AVJ3_PHYNI|nr:hypothetical protein F444_03008 [Phytophthora nicotianae P1976]
MIWTISKEDLDEKIAVARLLLSSGSNPNYLSVSVAKASLEQHRMGLLACAHHWHDCYEKGKPLTMIPSEVIEGGEDAVRTFLDDLEKTSADQLVYRSKVCIVGPSTWGKTSLVKSMTKNEPLPENIEDRTIGIDLFPFTFKENSNDGTTSKQHDVTFWDFAGQDIYHVTHALFFSERTMYLICVDLSVYAKKLEEVKMCTALKQTVVMERFFEENVLRWVRFILFRQPSAQFKVIGTKVDLVSDIEVKHISSDMNCHMTSFLKNLDKGVTDEAKDALNDVFKPSNLVVFSAKLEDSIAKARQSIEQAIIDKPNLSIMMPATYSQVLAQIVKTRRPDANATPANRVKQVIVPFRALFNKLMDVPNLEDAGKCQAILRVLHNLGDILWYGDNGKDRDSIANPDELIILDPKLMLDIVSEVVNHNYDTRKGNLYEALRRDGTLHHSLLITFTWWEALKEAGDNMVPLFKRFLQHFNLAYPASIAEKLDEVDMIVPMYWKTRAEAQETVKPLAKQPSMLTRISVTGSAFAKWKYSLPAAISEAVYVNFVVQCYRQDAARNVGPAHVECFVRGEFCAVIKFVADKSGRCDDIEIEVAAATHEVAWAEMRDIIMSMESVLRKYPGLKSMKQGMLERYIVKPDDDGEHDHIVVSGLVANPSELKQKRFKMPWLPLDFDWYIQRAWENPGKLEELRAQKITLQLPHRLDVLRQLVVSSETRQLPALWTLLYSKETSEIVLRIHSDISGLCHHVPLRITVPNKFVMEHSDSIQAGVLVLSVLSSLIPTDIAKTAVEMALSVSSTALDHAQTVNSILAKAGLSPGKARSATEFDMPISSRAALLRDILKLHDPNFDHLKVSEWSNLRSAAHNETGRFVWVHERELEEMKDHLTPRDLPPPPPASNSISTTTSTPIPLPTHSPKATRVSTPVVSPTSTTIVPSTSRPIATSISIRVTKLVWPGRAKGRKKIYCEWEIVHQLKRAGNGKTEEAADLGADIEWSSQSEKLVNVSSIIMLQESTVKIFVKQRRQFLKCFRDKVIGLGAVQLKDHKDRIGSASSNSKPVHIEIALAGMKIPQSSTVTCEISIEQ